MKRKDINKMSIINKLRHKRKYNTNLPFIDKYHKKKKLTIKRDSLCIFIIV